MPKILGPSSRIVRVTVARCAVAATSLSFSPPDGVSNSRREALQTYIEHLNPTVFGSLVSALEMVVLNFGGRLVGDDQPVFVIAEIGQNHQGESAVNATAGIYTGQLLSYRNIMSDYIAAFCI